MKIQATRTEMESQPTPEKAKIAKAAQEFEAMLLACLLNSFQKSMTSLPGGDNDAASDSYGEFGVESMAAGVSAAGGLGIARLLTSTLLK